MFLFPCMFLGSDTSSYCPVIPCPRLTPGGAVFHKRFSFFILGLLFSYFQDFIAGLLVLLILYVPVLTFSYSYFRLALFFMLINTK